MTRARDEESNSGARMEHEQLLQPNPEMKGVSLREQVTFFMTTGTSRSPSNQPPLNTVPNPPWASFFPSLMSS